MLFSRTAAELLFWRAAAALLFLRADAEPVLWVASVRELRFTCGVAAVLLVEELELDLAVELELLVEVLAELRCWLELLLLRLT